MKLKDSYEGIILTVQKLEKKYPQIAYIYALVGSLMLTLASLVVKYCYQFPVYELVYFRSIIILLFIINLISITGEQIYFNDKKAFKFLMLRSLFSAASTLFFFTSSQMIDLGEATVLFLTSPIWSNIVSYFFFGEQFCLTTFVYTIISFISIVFLLKPPFMLKRDIESDKDLDYNSTILLGQALSIGGAICYAINSNLNKLLKGKTSLQQLVFYLHAGSLFVSSLLKTSEGYSSTQIYSFGSIVCILLFSVLQYLLQIFINQALFMKGANKILPFNYSQILFALIFDFFLFHKTIDLIQLISSIVIMYCCYKIAIKN